MIGLIHPLRTLENQGCERQLDRAKELWSDAAAQLERIKTFLAEYTRSMDKPDLTPTNSN